jgi:hypothetical protein
LLDISGNKLETRITKLKHAGILFCECQTKFGKCPINLEKLLTFPKKRLTKLEKHQTKLDLPQRKFENPITLLKNTLTKPNKHPTFLKFTQDKPKK